MATTAQTRAASFGPDQAPYAAASLRGALRGEPYPITVLGASSKTFNVPTAWKNALVRIQAEGADVYYVISTDATLAVVSKTAVCTEANSPIDLTPPAQGCGRIYNGQWQDVPFPANATTFALQGAADCVARCHLAET